MSNSNKKPVSKPRQTKQRRINLTVDAELEELLRRFAAAQDLSLSGSITSFLRDISNEIRGITEALEYAKSKPDIAKEKLLDMLLEAQHTANQGQLEISQLTEDIRAKSRKPAKPKDSAND